MNEQQLALDFGELTPKPSNANEGEILHTYLAEARLQVFPGDVEFWEIGESNADLSYLSHAFFRYYGKFPPPVAKRFIHELHDPGAGPVVDPMVGSGTTLVEAALCKRQAIGLDINPLSLLVSKVKITPIPQRSVLDAVHAYELFARSTPAADVASYIPRDHYLNHWFYPETQLALAHARFFIDTQISDSQLRDFFRVGLAAIIRRVSRASNGMGRMFLDPAIPPQNVGQHLSRKLRQMTEVCESIGYLRPQITTLLHDARQPFLSPEMTNLVICHPPYFNLYRYSSIYKYEMLWLGYPYGTIKPGEVREGFKIAQKEMVADYIDDLIAVLRNIARVLVPGGWCILMMGDTILRGERIDTTARTIQQVMAADLGLKPRRLIVRRPKFTEASYAAAQRRPKDLVGVKLSDHLVVFEKVSRA